MAGTNSVDRKDAVEHQNPTRSQRFGLRPPTPHEFPRLIRPNKRVVKFYNGRGTAEQHIKEGKNALRWTWLSCHTFRHNAVRLQLHALACNLANFLRTLALPQEVEHWSLTTLREKLVKIGARIVRHGRYVVFQLAEVAVPRALFAEIPRRIDRLRPRPPPLPT
jgi:Transposase DDE domain group 1